MILFARPSPHLPRTQQVLQNAGFAPETCCGFSLAEPQYLPISIPENATALILTSPLACPSLAKALQANPRAKSLPIFCVGPTTAEATRALGLTVTFTGTDNGHTMAHDMLMLDLPTHTFAHLHGDHAGMEWHSILKAAGHSVTPVAAYRTNHIESLPSQIATKLSLQSFPAYTLLFSAGSARHLANLLKHANITPNGTALCLSEAVAEVAKSYWPHQRIATQPTLEGVIALLPKA